PLTRDYLSIRSLFHCSLHDALPISAQLRPEFVLGICTVQGGPTAHAAILARALGIPAIAGLNEAALQIIHSGDATLLHLDPQSRSEEHTSELQSHLNLVCRLMLEKK